MQRKLTKRTIDGLAPAGTDYIVWDTDLRGYGLRVKPSGAKSFLVQYRNRFGVSKRHTLGTYGEHTPDEARKAARDALHDGKKGNDPGDQRRRDREALTVAQLCDEYIERVESGQLLTRRGKEKKQSTIYTDKGRIERHIKPLIGRMIAKEVTLQDIEDFQFAVIKGKTRDDVKTGPRGRAIVRGGRGAAARTVGLLGAIFAYGMKRKYVESNPVRGIIRPKDQKRKVKLAETEYRTIGAALKAAADNGERWQWIEAIRTFLLTGCRLSEVVKLRKGDLDHENGCLRLADSKTDESLRPLGSHALAVLRAASNQAEGEFIFALGKKPSPGLDKALKRIFKDTEAGHLTSHGLRHGFTATADRCGLSLPTIDVLTGHASRGVTQDYINQEMTFYRSEAEKVTAAITRAMNGETAEVIELKAARQ